MIDDFASGKPLRKKTKRIEPLPKPAKKPLHELAAAEDASFQTPEQVANTEANSSNEPTIATHDETIKKQWWHLRWPLTKQQWIIGSLLVVVLLGVIGTGWALTHHKHPAQAGAKVATKTAKPVVVYSTLSGLPVADASINKRPVTGVMIENSVDARPQSGLSQAGVVFEAVAEGGVTRFLALFQDQQPSDIGPVRSARPYYVQWDLGFDAPYAHVGGSPDALSDITSWGVRDLNQFYNGDAYHRISSRASPHNVYTGVDTLTQLETSKGYATSTFSSFPRKADAPYKPSTQPSKGSKPSTNQPTPTGATSIDFSLSGYTYDPHYDYDAVTNSYRRSEAGQPQTDANGGAQLRPKVAVAMVVPLARGALDASGAYYSDYNVIGSGQAYIFQDGTVTIGTWSKASNTAQITFTDASGTPIAFNRGQTWLTAVTDAGKVVYK